MADDGNTIDEYQLINCIAMGKFSAVWEVMEEGTPNRFAMKLLLSEALATSAQVRSLKFEAKVGQSLDHPSLIRMHALVIRRDAAYLVMDLFKSQNLKNFLANDLIGVQMRIGKLMESVCMALGHMHDRGWIHKDVKPDNILMNKGSEVRLIDFSLSVRKTSGLASMLDRKSKTIQGTRSYIAPETIRKQTPTPQTDLYSLGVTLFEILTGRPPFMGATPQDLLRQHIGAVPIPPSELNPNVTPEMDRLVQRLLAKKPKDRPGSAQELYGEFRNINPFKEDLKIETQEEDEVDEDLMTNTDMVRLDSRFDHKRSELFKGNPELAKSFEAGKKALADKNAAEAAKPSPESEPTPEPEPSPPQQQQPAPPQPVQPQPVFQQPIPKQLPTQPPYPYQQPGMIPQMPMPQMPMQPAAPMQQMPMQPVVPYPQQPVVPQQGTPAMPMQPPIQQPQPAATQQPPTPQPVQPAIPQPQQPLPPSPTPVNSNPAPATPTNAPPAAAPNPTESAPNSLPDNDDDLPLMDELPDVF